MLTNFVRRSAMWKASRIKLSVCPDLSRKKTLQLSSALKDTITKKRFDYFKDVQKIFNFPCLSVTRRFTTINTKNQDEDNKSLNTSKQDLNKENKKTPTGFRIPFGIQTFEKIRDEQLIYVDKTHLIHELVSQCRRIFLCRPRRFGKSLTLSTLEAVFEGKKHLFQDDLFIKQTDDEFWSRFENKFAVIKLDMSQISGSSSIEEFRNLFCEMLLNEALRHSIKLEYNEPTIMLMRLVHSLSLRYAKSAKAKQQVVILIDEYDAPLNDAIEREFFQDIQQELRSFYTMIKSLDEYLYFVFITGVAKYAPTSIFSGMNNLEDISYRSEYHALCGFTEEEIRTNFKSNIGSIASLKRLEEQQIITEILENFNGYRFIPTIETSQRVISPQLFYSYLKHQRIDQATWFSTGSSNFLLEILKDVDPELLENLISENTTLSMSEILDSVDPNVFKSNVPLILFQAGYLTLKQATAGQGLYKLAFPNLDIKRSFSRLIAEIIFKGAQETEIFSIIHKLKDGDYASYFNFIALHFCDKSFGLTQLKRTKEPDYHSRFSFINKVLANITKGVTVVDHLPQATGYLVL